MDDSFTGWGLRSWDIEGIYRGFWKCGEGSGSGTPFLPRAIYIKVNLWVIKKTEKEHSHLHSIM